MPNTIYQGSTEHKLGYSPQGLLGGYLYSENMRNNRVREELAQRMQRMGALKEEAAMPNYLMEQALKSGAMAQLGYEKAFQTNALEELRKSGLGNTLLEAQTEAQKAATGESQRKSMKDVVGPIAYQFAKDMEDAEAVGPEAMAQRYNMTVRAIFQNTPPNMRKDLEQLLEPTPQNMESLARSGQAWYQTSEDKALLEREKIAQRDRANQTMLMMALAKINAAKEKPANWNEIKGVLANEYKELSVMTPQQRASIGKEEYYQNLKALFAQAPGVTAPAKAAATSAEARKTSKETTAGELDAIVEFAEGLKGQESGNKVRTLPSGKKVKRVE